MHYAQTHNWADPEFRKKGFNSVPESLATGTTSKAVELVAENVSLSSSKSWYSLFLPQNEKVHEQEKFKE